MEVYVYDNVSTDRTVERARDAGAVVRSEPRKGKGNVVRRAFADIDADIYLLIDGDDTYDAAAAPEMIERLVSDNLDQVVGVRRESRAASAYRAGARGRQPAAQPDRLRASSATRMGDMLSGYRVFSRRFVKSFPAVSREFEIETELTVHSLALRVPSATVDGRTSRTAPRARESKLRTYRDGWKILSVILNLTRHERPMEFFGLISLLLVLASVALGAPVLLEYLHTGQVPRLPTLVVASFGVLMAGVLFVAGLVIDGTRKARHEMSRLTYLRYPAVRGTYVTDPAYYEDAARIAVVPAPRAG